MQTGDDRNIFLSTMPATRRDRTAALAVVGVSAVLFACAVPFAGVPLTPVPAFVASYQSALAINDLITAVLLFSQFAISRSRALLLLASGYLFTAAAAIVHALTFPGLFAPGGLLGAGPQTTVWLYMIWHGGFPLLVLGYALLKANDSGTRIRGSTGAAIVASVVAVSVAMAAFDLGRHRPARPAADAAERRPLHAGHARRGIDGVVPQPRGAGGAVASPTAFGPRRLADGRDVRLAVRHRAVGDAERGAIRCRLLSRPHLRPLRGELRARGTADRQCRPAGQAGPPARNAAPGGGLGKKSPHRTRTPVQRGRGIIQRRHHHQIARRHHHRLERRRRTPVRLHCGGSGRREHQHHRPAGPARRRSAMSSSGSGHGEPIEHYETVARAQGRPQRRRFAERLADPVGLRRDRRHLQDRARHHRKQADAEGAHPGNRGAAAYLRDFERPHPGDRHIREFHPGQPERHRASSAISRRT